MFFSQSFQPIKLAADFRHRRVKKVSKKINTPIANQVPNALKVFIFTFHFSLFTSPINKLFMKIHCFQHVAFETPGSIAEWAHHHQHSINYTCFYERLPVFPLINDVDFLLVLGGSMNVDEETKYPWLREEKDFIRQAISAGKKVMGICLGSQLIARALGAKVYPQAEKEIGFFPVQFSKEGMHHPFFNHFKNPYMVFHWHGDTFHLPDGTALIASSQSCKNQLYLAGNNVLGFQFHLEMNETVINEMIQHDGEELNERGKFIQPREEIKNSYQYLAQNKIDLFRLMDKFIA